MSRTNLAALALGLLSVPVAFAAEQQADASTAPLDTIPVNALEDRMAPEQQDANQAVKLETVVVTGEKQNRSTAQTNTSVNVRKGRDIDLYGDQSVEDVLRRTGNAIASDNGQFSLRGVNSTGTESNEFGTPTASLFVDGVVLDRIGQQFGAADLFDIEQVEVLRGPQSTSQGRNALAGAIVVRTRDPADAPDLRFRLLGAEQERRQFAFAGGGGLLGNMDEGNGLAGRIAYERRQDGGDIPNITRNDPHWAFSDTDSARAKLKGTLGAYTGLVTVTQTLNRMGPDSNYERQSRIGSRTAESDAASLIRGRTRTAGIENGYALNEHFGLRLNLAALKSTQDSIRDLDMTAQPISTLAQEGGNETTTGELRFVITEWHRLRGFVGLYTGQFDTDFMAHGRGRRLGLNATTGTFVSVDYDSHFVNDATNHAVFTEFDWQALEKLTLTAGLRYDEERSKAQTPFTVTRADLVTCTPAGVCTPPVDALAELTAAGQIPASGDQTADGRYSAFLPKLGFRWQFTPDLAAGFTYSEGYRSGGAEVLYSTGQTNTYKPEYTRNYELFLRSEFLQRRLSLAFNTYYVDWRDQQVMLLTPDGADSYTSNAAKSRLAGAEIELNARPLRWISTYASLGYAYTQFEDYQSNGQDFSGKRFTKAPPFTASTGVSVKLPLDFVATVNYAHSDAFFTQPDNNAGSRNATYDLVDARIGWTCRIRGSGSLTLTAFGRNLTDRSYTVYRYPLPADAANGRDTSGQLVTYGAPRSFGVQLEGRF